MTMTRIRHAVTKLVHEARLDPKLKGSHYNFLCGRWCNLEFLDAYEKVEDETPVTCRRCLERIERKDWEKINTNVSEVAKVFKEDSQE